MSKATILMAENDSEFLATRKKFLEDEDYEVITANSATEARRILEQKRIDLAILDIRLTDDSDGRDISGLTLAKTVAPKIPKVILTKFPTYEEVREALGPGIDGLPAAVAFVAKQEGPEALLAAVKSSLETAESKVTETVASEEHGAERFTMFSRWRPIFALVSLLLALGAGVLAIVYADPRWLIGTIVLAIIAVFLIGLSSK